MLPVFYIILIVFVNTLECARYSSLDNTYLKGKEAYAKERWSECIVQFEEALHLHKLYQSITNNCRLQCKRKNQKSLLKEDIEDLKVLEYILNAKDCISKCHKNEFYNVGLLSNASDSVLISMQQMKPYEFLHICYFQMNALPKAASAAYTFWVANPDDNAMKNNVDFYLQQPEVDIKSVKNLQSQDYHYYHKLGLTTYSQNNWDDTVINMENALSHYLSWENTCRAACESQPEQEWSSEFYVSVSYNVASLLICRQSCQTQLKPFYDSGIEFLADTLNYLQICYYHSHKLSDAAKAVASYLLLLPDDEDMLENKNIYKHLIDENRFEERSDIAYYLTRDKYEKRLLELFHDDNFVNPEANGF
ncbi:cartilage-associated protein-like [Aricia agestis]|uniref:cartilage-associated protein-like n=1 Tax=Aricia agestis TaxID=91739 RepID=UPI001C204C3D|nr:cartilage-associated protein-like [Aricia agestis]